MQQIDERIQKYIQTNITNIKTNKITQQDQQLLLTIIDDTQQMKQLESILKFQIRIANNKWVSMIYMYYINQLESIKPQVIASLDISEELFIFLFHQLTNQEFNEELMKFIFNANLNDYHLYEWINPLTLEGKLIVQWLLSQDFEINKEINHFFYEHITHSFNNILESNSDWINFLKELYEKYGEIDYWHHFIYDYKFLDYKALQKADIKEQHQLNFQLYPNLIAMLAKYFPVELIDLYQKKLKEKFIIAYKQESTLNQVFLAWLINADYDEAVQKNKLSQLLYINDFEDETSASLLIDTLINSSYDWSNFINKSISELIDMTDENSMISLVLYIMCSASEIKVTSFIKQWMKSYKVKNKEIRNCETESLKENNIVAVSLEDLFQKPDTELKEYISETYLKLETDFDKPNVKEEFNRFSEFCKEIKITIENIDQSSEDSISKLKKINEIYNSVVNSKQEFKTIEVYDSLIRNVQKYIILYENIVEKEQHQVDDEKLLHTLNNNSIISNDSTYKIDLIENRIKGEYVILTQYIIKQFRINILNYLSQFIHESSLDQKIFASKTQYDNLQETMKLFFDVSKENHTFEQMGKQIFPGLLIHLLQNLNEKYQLDFVSQYYSAVSFEQLIKSLEISLEIKDYCLSNNDIKEFNSTKYAFNSLYEATLDLMPLVVVKEVIEEFVDQLTLAFRKLTRLNNDLKNELGFIEHWQDCLEAK